MHRTAPCRTLVADGDRDRALLVCSILAEQGRNADVADSLADAIATLERFDHDSLVLSLGLSGIAGVRAACEHRPDLAIVVLDVEANAETERAVLEVGAQDYVAEACDQLPPAIDRAVIRAGVVKRLRESEIGLRSMVDGLPGCRAIAFDNQFGVTHLAGQGIPSATFSIDYPGQPAAEVLGAERAARFRPSWERAVVGERFSEVWESPDGDTLYEVYVAPLDDALGNRLGCVLVAIDIRDRLAAESKLAAVRERHHALAEGVPVGIAEFDVNGECQYVNGRYSEITGVAVDDALGRPWSDFAHPDDVHGMVEEWHAAKAAAREFRLDHRVRRADGSFTWVAGHLREMVDEDGEPTGYLSTISDIEQRRRAEQAQREAMTLFAATFEQSPVGMGIYTVDGRYLQVNSALCQLLGRPAEEILGRHLDAFIHPDGQDSALSRFAELVSCETSEQESEVCLTRPDGTLVWTLLHTTVLRNEAGEPTQVFTQMIDIGKRRSHEAELRHLADHDALTGLFNRRRFEIELKRHIADGGRSGDVGAVLLLDLNRFKTINDAHGHHAGDRVLVAVAEVLRTRLRRSDVVGRIGGDEFAVLLREADAEQADAVAELLAASIAETGTTASIGVAALDGDVSSVDAVLVRADHAMYEVKRGLRGDGAAAHYFNW